MKLCSIKIPLKVMLFLCVFMLFIVLSPGHVEAHSQHFVHAQYDHSNPPANAHLPSGKPPLIVQVWFTEQVEPAYSYLHVFDQKRQRVDTNDSHIAPDNSSSLLISLHSGLPDGAYTVVFHTVSAEDGHVVTNNFSFVVGGGALPTGTGSSFDQAQDAQAADSNLNPWSVAIRWINYLGLAGLVGSLIFLLLVWRPSITSLAEDMKGVLDKASEQMNRRTLQYVFGYLLLLALGWVSFLMYQVSVVSAISSWQAISSGALVTFLLHSRFGAIWLLRLTLLLAAFLTLFFERRMRKRRLTDRLLWLLLVLSVVLLFTNSLNSHAAAQRAAWILVATDWLHLLGTGFWVGGLFSLVLILPAAISTLAPGTGNRTRVFAVLIPVFTRIALLSVGLLLITGTGQALVQLGVLDTLLRGDFASVFAAFWESSYGRALLLKVGIFGLLILLGACNAFIISPRMRKFAARTGDEDGARSFAAGALQRRFQRVVRVEFALALLLLLIVGALTSLSPPPAPVSASTKSTGPLFFAGQTADISYRMEINPGKIGSNTFTVELKISDNRPMTQVDGVLAHFIMLDMDMGVQVLQFAPIGGRAGEYTATTDSLSMSGNWEMDLIVRRADFADVKIKVYYTLQQ